MPSVILVRTMPADTATLQCCNHGAATKLCIAAPNFSFRTGVDADNLDAVLAQRIVAAV
jgi:hypothetical protein